MRKNEKQLWPKFKYGQFNFKFTDSNSSLMLLNANIQQKLIWYMQRELFPDN